MSRHVRAIINSVGCGESSGGSGGGSSLLRLCKVEAH